MQESLEKIAAMDPTRTMSTPKRKKIKKSKRQVIGYNPTAPQMCSNCAHFRKSLYAKKQREYFPPRCEKYLLAVESQGVCNYWEDREAEHES